MVYVTMRDMIVRYETHYDPGIFANTTVIEEDRELVSQFSAVPDNYLSEGLELSAWLLRFELNTTVLKKHRIRVTDLVTKIQELMDNNVHLEYNDEFCETCVIRIRPYNDKLSWPTDDEKLLQDVAIFLLDNITPYGIKGIKKTYCEYRKGTNEYVIETLGSNMAEVMGIPEIDFARTTTNDPHEALAVCGVEGARNTVGRELTTNLSFDGGYVNSRHIMELADVMTKEGELMSITRHGINRRVEYGPWSKCSFEETVEVLHDAARYAEQDNLKGVTEAIIMGTNTPIGTHTFDVLLDTKKVKHMHLLALISLDYWGM